MARWQPWIRLPLLIFLSLLLFEYYLLESSYTKQKSHQQYKLYKKKKTTSTHSRFSAQSSHQTKKPSPSFRFHSLWDDLQLTTCRFPSFFDPSQRFYNLNETTFVEPGWKRRMKLRNDAFAQERRDEQTNEYQQMMVRKQVPHNHVDNLEIPFNLSFVHVGKAGGSSVGCQLAASRRYVRKHCDPLGLQQPTSLTPLNLHTNCYTHWQGHMYCYSENTAFLVNIRNPVDRMASWFLYEHVQNHAVTYAERNYHCGDLMLFSCFDSWDVLVSIGLQSAPRTNKELRIGPNLTQEECSVWAWAAIEGSIPASYHNFYNYDWYTHRMFLDGKPKQVFVLRAEHLESDFESINNMLMEGGDKKTWNFGLNHTCQNAAHEKPLKVTNRTVSQVGKQNLCQALCHEIQIYKDLLSRAVNLEATDVMTSLRELQKTCPIEATRSKCPSLD